MIPAHVEELLSAYGEGELDAARAAEVGAHLASCSECASLFDALTLAREALGSFPEIDPSPELLAKLYAIPETAGRRFHFVRDFLLRPSLQPVFAGATGLLVFLSFLTFSPAGHDFRKGVSRQLHSGYNAIGKLYAKAGSITDEIGAYKETVLGSLKEAKILKATGVEE